MPASSYGKQRKKGWNCAEAMRLWVFNSCLQLTDDSGFYGLHGTFALPFPVHVAPGDSRPPVPFLQLLCSPLPHSGGSNTVIQTVQVMDRSGSLHRASTTLYFMSGPEAPYYFAINFIPYRTMSHRQRYLSFWHLSASVAQIKHDSLIPKSVLKRLGLHKQLSATQSRHLAFMLDLKCLSNACFPLPFPSWC
jgi:hypothetical protein